MAHDKSGHKFPTFDLLSPGDKVVAAVSGGMDSMVMLDLLVRCGFRPIVAHFNHQIRKESALDAEIVRDAARRLGLEFQLGEGDVPDRAAARKIGLEEAAREMRYAFLFSVCEKETARALLVAHNLDDQVETILMHLLRGAGLDGIRGMRAWAMDVFPQQVVPIYRPLLGWSRDQVRAYSLEHQVVYREDVSNQDRRFFRNRLRGELLPLLDSLNPASREHLVRFAELAGDEVELINEITDAAWERAIERATNAEVQFRLPELLNLSPALRRRVIRRVVQNLLSGERDVGSSMVTRLESYCQYGTKSGRITLNNQLLAERRGNGIILYLASAPLNQDWIALANLTASSLDVPGEVLLANSWKLRAEFCEPADFNSNLQREGWLWQVDIDADTLSSGLEIRAWLPGERYRTYGLGGHSIKLSDMFINAKVPRAVRKSWPVVASGTDLVWVPGFPPAFPNRITSQTRRVLRLVVTS